MPIVIALLAAGAAGYVGWTLLKKRDAARRSIDIPGGSAAARKTVRTYLESKTPEQKAAQVARMGYNPAAAAKTAAEVPPAGLLMGAALGSATAIEELRRLGFDVSMYTAAR